MDAVLIDAWLDGLRAAPTLDEASVSAAREAVRAEGARIGLERTLIEGVVVAASELVHNQLRHARGGRFAVRATARGGVPGIEIIAVDAGRGIADPARALAGMGGSSTSLGAGLAAARRMTHEMDIDVRAGEGTLVRARAFAAPLPRRREIGVLGRPCPGELVSGDHAAFVRRDHALVVAVVDGVGHGAPAREAAAEAVAAFLAHSSASPLLILDACDAAVASLRGAVMAVARIDEHAGLVDHAAVGNVNTRVERFRASRILSGSSSTLGARAGRKKPLAESMAIEPAETVIMYTDGITSRLDLASDPDLLREHPIVIAEHIIANHARGNDDALVLVAR